MARKKINLRDELQSYKYDFHLLQNIPCSKEENKAYKKLLKDDQQLPKGVYAYTYEDGTKSKEEFYTISETDLTKQELAEYFTYRRLSLFTTIKNCAMWFTVLATIALVIRFIFLFVK